MIGNRAPHPAPAASLARAPRSREERIDAFERILKEFMAEPRADMKETLLEACYSAYKARSFGSAIGLEAELETLEKMIDNAVAIETRRQEAAAR